MRILLPDWSHQLRPARAEEKLKDCPSGLADLKLKTRAGPDSDVSHQKVVSKPKCGLLNFFKRTLGRLLCTMNDHIPVPAVEGWFLHMQLPGETRAAAPATSRTPGRISPQEPSQKPKDHQDSHEIKLPGHSDHILQTSRFDRTPSPRHTRSPTFFLGLPQCGTRPQPTDSPAD